MNPPFIRVALLRLGHLPQIGLLENDRQVFRDVVGGELGYYFPNRNIHPALDGMVAMYNDRGLLLPLNHDARALGLATGGPVIVCGDGSVLKDLTDATFGELLRAFPDIDFVEYIEVGDSNTRS